ncbi:MAG TPA: OpgC domain-containing protein [Acidobacteriaceae bacterium]|jgi:hypothetical protein|nr:OpgC domain-containing protein [Acidobacteriaceae bacterium]
MHLPKLRRLPELDALRGLFLVWMILVHLPTHISNFADQPFGFVSAAEGFVFLSAVLVGRIYYREHMLDQKGVRRHLWRRSFRIYAYHIALLAFAFSILAVYAVHTHRAALTNLLNFYLNHPGPAIVGSVFLIYCPPLFDILPLYVTFLFLSPLILSAATRFRWRTVVGFSLLLWLGAQFGLRDAFHNLIVHLTHLHIPLQETGSFNMFAWQAVWVTGLWMGSASAHGDVPLARTPRWAIPLSAAICVFFAIVRYGWFGPHLDWPALGLLVDKWQLGPLRVVNLVAFAIFFFWLRKWVVLLISREPFLTMGKASLQVFCAHLFFVFIGLALLYGDMEQLGWPTAILLIAVTFLALFWVAAREVRKRRQAKEARIAAATQAVAAPPGPPPQEPTLRAALSANITEESRLAEAHRSS